MNGYDRSIIIANIWLVGAWLQPISFVRWAMLMNATIFAVFAAFQLYGDKNN